MKLTPADTDVKQFGSQKRRADNAPAETIQLHFINILGATFWLISSRRTIINTNCKCRKSAKNLNTFI